MGSTLGGSDPDCPCVSCDTKRTEAITELCRRLHAAQETIIRLAQDNVRLNEIIAKLPKCWRLNDMKDGLVQDVPVVPHGLGMEIYLVDLAGGIFFRKVNAIALDNDQWRLYYFGMVVGKPENFYDSREAAEFALSQVEQEKMGG